MCLHDWKPLILIIFLASFGLGCSAGNELLQEDLPSQTPRGNIRPIIVDSGDNLSADGTPLFGPGSEIEIEWTVTGDQPQLIDVLVSTDQGATWETVVISIPNTGQYSFLAPPTIPDGAIFRVRLTEENETSNVIAETGNLIYDSSAPEIEIVGPANDMSNGDQVTLIIRSSEPLNVDLAAELLEVTNGTIVSVVADPDNPNQYLLTLEPTEEGPVSVTIKSDQIVDQVGNVATSDSTYEFIFDQTEPVLTLPTPPTVPVSELSMTVNCDEDCVVKYVIYRMVGAVPELVFESEYTDDLDVLIERGEFPMDGDYFIEIIAKDGAGNESVAQSFNLEVDVTEPSLNPGDSSFPSITKGQPSNSNSPSIDLTNLGAEIGTTVDLFDSPSCTGSPIASETIASANHTITPTYPSDGSADGEKQFFAVLTDPAGNTSACLDLDLNYTLDTVVPTVTLSSGLTMTNSPTFQMTATFSEDMLDFTLSDINITNGVASNLSGGPRVFTFDVTPTPNQTVEIQILGAIATDEATNGNAASVTLQVVHDIVKPSVSLSSSEADPTNSSTFSVTATFDEDVTGFDLSDLNITSGTVGNLAGGPQVYTFEVTPDLNQLVSLSVNASAATDGATNTSHGSNTLTRQHDGDQPTVSLSSGEPNPTNSVSFSVSATFNENVSGLLAGDIQVTNGTASNVTGGPQVYSFDITPAPNQTVEIQIPGAATDDDAGNGNIGSNTIQRDHDNAAPTVVVSSSEPDPTNSSAFSVTAFFDEDMTGFTLGDVNVTNGSASNLAGGPQTFTFDITPVANQTVEVEIPTDVADDPAGNGNSLSNTFQIVHDTQDPSVTISSATSSPTNSALFSVTATFDEDVSDFTLADIGMTNGVASNLAGGPQVYTFDVTPSPNQLVEIQVGASTVVDSAGNDNTISNNFQITHDNTEPTVTLSSAEPDPTNSSSFSVTATFNENMLDFVIGDIDVTNGSASNLVGGPQIFTFDITPTANQTVGVQIPASSADDPAGNGNTISNTFQIVHDQQVPTVVLSSSEPDPTNSATFSVTATFNENMSGFAIGDINVTNGSASNLGGGPMVFTFDVTPVANQTVEVQVPADAADDPAGNGNSISNNFQIVHDQQAPSVTLSSIEPDPTNSSSFSVTATFNENMSDFALGDIDVTNGSASNLTGGPQVFTFDITSTPNQTVEVQVPANAADDPAGNGNTISNTFQIVHDSQSPTLVLSSAEPDPTNSANFTVTATFNEDMNDFVLSDIDVTNGSASSLSGGPQVFTFTITPDTNQTVNVDIAADEATDDAGNGNAAATTLSRTHDIQPPTGTSVAIDSSSPTSASTLDIDLAATDVAEMYLTETPGCTSGGSWESFSTTTTFNFAASNTNLVLYAKFRDDLENESGCSSSNFVLHDDIGPSNATSLSISETEWIYSESPEMTFNSGSDGGSGVSHYEVQVLDSSNVVQVNWTPFLSGDSFVELDLIPESQYKYRIRTIDNAGNPSGSTDSALWTAKLWPRLIGLGTSENLFGGSAYQIGPKPSHVLFDVVTVATGNSDAGGHTCVLDSSNDVYCWGHGGDGQLGNNGFYGAWAFDKTPKKVFGSESYVELDSGDAHVCARTTTNDVYCWGKGTDGRQGDGGNGKNRRPQLVLGGHDFIQVSAGDRNTCAVTSGNDAYCWGSGLNGALGNGAETASNVPVLVSGGHSFVQVTVGNLWACGLTTAQDIYCWGHGAQGRLGNGGTSNSLTPSLVSGSHDWLEVHAGGGQTCARTTAKEVYCWGYGLYGELGLGSGVTEQLVPAKVLGTHDYDSLSLGPEHSCAINSSHQAYCWGWNGRYQFGLDGPVVVDTPILVPGGIPFAQIAPAYGHTCAKVDVTNQLYCWGETEGGVLGEKGATSTLSVPTVTTDIYMKSVSAWTSRNACGIDNKDRVRCWGDGFGALGNGSWDDRASPTLINSPHTFTQVGYGYDHACALSTSDDIYCWGSGSYGQLGDGVFLPADNPVMVAGGHKFRSLAVADHATCAIRISDNRAFCWGMEERLGDNDANGDDSATPVQVAGGLTFKTLNAISNSNAICGTTFSDDAYCWGYNFEGNLGTGDTSARNIPTAVLGGIKFKQVYPGSSFTCGIDTSDQLHCWGSNGGGFGNNSTANSLTPTPAGIGQSFKKVSLGYNHTCGITTSDELYCWGNGELAMGQGDTAQQLLPVKAASGTFTDVAAFEHALSGGTLATAAPDPMSIFDIKASNPNPISGGSTVLDTHIIGDYDDYCIQENDDDVSNCSWTPGPLDPNYTFSSGPGSRLFLNVWVRDSSNTASFESSPIILE